MFTMEWIRFLIFQFKMYILYPMYIIYAIYFISCGLMEKSWSRLVNNTHKASEVWLITFKTANFCSWASYLLVFFGSKIKISYNHGHPSVYRIVYFMNHEKKNKVLDQDGKPDTWIHWICSYIQNNFLQKKIPELAE